MINAQNLTKNNIRKNSKKKNKKRFNTLSPFMNKHEKVFSFNQFKYFCKKKVK